MITTKAKKYCAGDITKIQNFHQAAIDPTQVWFLFHRNIITGVGRINSSTLKALGKFYNCPPEELVFLKKQDMRKVEEMVDPSTYHGGSCHIVFKFWKQLHPDKLFLEIKDEEFKVLHRSIRRLRILYNQMKARCHNPNAQDFPHYGKQGVRVCAEWLNDSDSFVLWALKSGYIYYPEKPRGEQLSIDRIDPKRNYMPCNCRWIPQRQNCSRTRTPNQEALTARSLKFARMFSDAANFCWGRWRIDWKKVRDEYMNGDTSTLVNFLKAEGYCSMAIYHIRKRLGEVIPQKKSER